MKRLVHAIKAANHRCHAIPLAASRECRPRHGQNRQYRQQKKPHQRAFSESRVSRRRWTSSGGGGGVAGFGCRCSLLIWRLRMKSTNATMTKFNNVLMKRPEFSVTAPDSCAAVNVAGLCSPLRVRRKLEKST